MGKNRRALYWTPRILSILFILFLSLFSLDVFEPGLGGGEIALALLMHNIPSLILTVLVILACRREIVGAVAFLGAGLAYVGFVLYGSAANGLPWQLALSWSLTIAGPAFLVGILYLINWKKRREGRQKQ